MDFELTDEQRQLRDSLARLVARTYRFDQRRAILASADGYSREVWRQLAELGVLALGIPEDLGGLGGTAVDVSIVMEVFGANLVVEPYLSSIVVGAGLLARAGSDAHRREILPRVIAGDHLLALAHGEPDSRHELAHVATRATADRGRYAIDGRKDAVVGGGTADTLIVSARTSGLRGDASGVTLFAIPADAPGIARRRYTMCDGHAAADVTLAAVEVGDDAIVGTLGGGVALVEEAAAHAIAAVCAEALGTMVALVDLTTTHVKSRKQFGVPIGSFQVLQHRLADMLMRLEQARSMTYLVASAVGSPDARTRARVASAAKALVSTAARFVGQQAIQLHGAIGITDEARASHYFKRLTALGLQFGDADHHVARFGEL